MVFGFSFDTNNKPLNKTRQNIRKIAVAPICSELFEKKLTLPSDIVELLDIKVIIRANEIKIEP